MQAAAVNYPSMSPMAGVAAYGRAAQSALSPAQASLILHERLCLEVMAAKADYMVGRLDAMCTHIEKITRVLMALQNDIKFTPGDVNSTILSGFYLHVHGSLSAILRSDEPSVEFDNIITRLQNFNVLLSTAARAAA